jgi:type II secretory pathway component PulF
VSSPVEEFKLQFQQLLPGNRPPRASLEELSTFTRQFAAMLDAGIPLYRALNFFTESLEDKGLRRILEDVCQKVHSGVYLSRALRSYPRVFSEVYCSLVETGERSGQLQDLLNRLADLLEKNLKMQKKLISTFTYPAILFLVSMASVCFFVFFLLPMIQPMFDSMKIALPWPTRLLLATRTLLLPTLIVGAMGLFLLWAARPWLRAFLRQRPGMQAQLSRLPMELPILGTLLQKMATTRILYAMTTMLESGMPMVDAMSRATAVAGNVWVSQQMTAARRDMVEGMNLGEALARNVEIFPRAAVYLISVGEETGGLTDMLRYAARIYDEEVELAMTDLAALLEPLLMAGMGLVVGFIVISAILPTLQLIRNF